MDTAFQADAFQGDAFQIDGGAPAPVHAAVAAGALAGYRLLKRRREEEEIEAALFLLDLEL
jgi:hypothetical protein